MKFIQLSDLHLVPPGQNLKGLNPAARLDAAIAAINARHSDAAFCVLSGDLTHAGNDAAYRHLSGVLEGLKIPYYLMIGNHDLRDRVKQRFPETQCDENGFVQYHVEVGAHVFLMLDTFREKSHWGEYCAKRGDWLRAILAQFKARPVHIFMHHPPFDMGIPSLDVIRLLDTQHFERAIGTSGDIRQILFGHIHRPLSGHWHGIPVTAVPCLNHQVQLDLVTTDHIPLSHEPPMFGVGLVGDAQTIVHFDNFMDQSAIDEAQGMEYEPG
jgi:3',5'-cyclic AMP phosphodiesterase CpdA